LAIKLTITPNGHSAAILSDGELRGFHDIEFSLDYPNKQEQDAQITLRSTEELFHLTGKRRAFRMR
jgi:hypothetical protein